MRVQLGSTIARIVSLGLVFVIAQGAGWKYEPPPEPTVHEVPLPKLAAMFEKFVASKPGMRKSPFIVQILNSHRYSEEQAGELMKDRTTLFFDETFGPQLEYTSPEGLAFLWFPGNRRILKGQWYIRDQEVGFTSGNDKYVSKAGTICYYYGANTYNPATRKVGKPECQNSGVHEARVVESRVGDVLGLSRTENVPFVLGTGSTSIEDVRNRIQGTRKLPE